LKQLPVAPVTAVEGNGISGQSRLEAGLITVAIGVDPVRSNKWTWLGIKVQAKQGVPVSVNTTPNRSKK
jgi:hypothetical protein